MLPFNSALLPGGLRGLKLLRLGDGGDVEPNLMAHAVSEEPDNDRRIKHLNGATHWLFAECLRLPLPANGL